MFKSVIEDRRWHSPVVNVDFKLSENCAAALAAASIKRGDGRERPNFLVERTAYKPLHIVRSINDHVPSANNNTNVQFSVEYRHVYRNQHLVTICDGTDMSSQQIIAEPEIQQKVRVPFLSINLRKTTQELECPELRYTTIWYNSNGVPRFSQDRDFQDYDVADIFIFARLYASSATQLRREAILWTPDGEKFREYPKFDVYGDRMGRIIINQQGHNALEVSYDNRKEINFK